MYELGLMLLLGEGGPADPCEGIVWLEKAAATEGFIAEDARRLLYDRYKHGQSGVDRNDGLAERWR